VVERSDTTGSDPQHIFDPGGVAAGWHGEGLRPLPGSENSTCLVTGGIASLNHRFAIHFVSSTPAGSQPHSIQHIAKVSPMASTYLSLHYHLVFATKNRTPTIVSAWRARLHEYLGGEVAGLDGFPQGIGGMADHVHLLVGLKATHCLADFMRELKKAASIWVHDEIGQRDFAWQEGYAAFTVSATARADVRNYIATQEEHHRVKSSREELSELLQRAGIEYDPRYFD
jgi:putative transposase